MTDITINLDQYNLLFEKAVSFDKIVDAVKMVIDKKGVYDMYSAEASNILLLTGLTRYEHERLQAMANSAKAELAASMKEQIETQNAEIAALKEQIERMQSDVQPEPEEEENHAEDQAEH